MLYCRSSILNLGVADDLKWKMKQPGFIDWGFNPPPLMIKENFMQKQAVEWDGTMNMPVLPLADKDHEQARFVYNLY